MSAARRTRVALERALGLTPSELSGETSTEQCPIGLTAEIFFGSHAKGTCAGPYSGLLFRYTDLPASGQCLRHTTGDNPCPDLGSRSGIKINR
jgi:hypothetical protein